MNVYEQCPILENEHYLLRLVEKQDVDDLLEVYSDKYALPYFNSDNCDGDNFYYPTYERMDQAIDFWVMAYENKWFVRFAILDKQKKKVIGTIELFHRDAEDHYNDCGLLRLDIKSEYENSKILADILSVIVEPAYELFDCSKIAMKAALYAVDRIEALEKMGFQNSVEPLIGKNQIVYYDYWERMK